MTTTDVPIPTATELVARFHKHEEGTILAFKTIVQSALNTATQFPVKLDKIQYPQPVGVEHAVTMWLSLSGYSMRAVQPTEEDYGGYVIYMRGTVADVPAPV